MATLFFFLVFTSNIIDGFCNVHEYNNNSFGFTGDEFFSNSIYHNYSIYCGIRSWLSGDNVGGNTLLTSNALKPELCSNFVFRGNIYRSNIQSINRKETTFTFESDAETVVDNFEKTFKTLQDIKTRFPEKYLVYIAQLGRFHVGKGVESFDAIYSSLQDRRKLALNILNTMKKYGFHELWILPAEQVAGKTASKELLTNFIRDLYYLLQPNDLNCGIFLPLGGEKIKKNFEIPEIQQFVNLFILTGSPIQETTTQIKSPVYGKDSFDSTIQYLKSHGVSPTLLIMTIDTMYTPVPLKQPIGNAFGLGDLIQYDNFSTPKNVEYLKFTDVCKEVKFPGIWNMYLDEATHSPFMKSNSGMWSSVEDMNSVALKAKFGVQNQVGGFALTFISGDDPEGSMCGVSFPLLRSINYVLNTFNYTEAQSIATPVCSCVGCFICFLLCMITGCSSFLLRQ